MNTGKDKKIEDLLASFESSSPEAKPEAIERPETLPEQRAEAIVESAPVQAEPKLEAVKPAPFASAPTAPVQDRGIYYRQVEGILEEGLTEVFGRMPAEKQEEFKKAGEQTASKIASLLSSAKVKAKKIFSLIINWLKIIPGVNRFFLEQEAKIKTDRILELKNRQ